MDHEARLAVVENKVEYYENFLDKLDVAIDRMSEASSHISKMLAVHEERLQHASKIDEMILSTVENNKKDTNNKLETIKDFSETETRELHEKIDKIQLNVIELQKLKWVVNGIGIAASISVVAITGLFQGMLTPANLPGIMKTPQVQQK
jgi:hypothetical protein